MWGSRVACLGSGEGERDALDGTDVCAVPALCARRCIACRTRKLSGSQTWPMEEACETLKVPSSSSSSELEPELDSPDELSQRSQ
mmetsp:Transcript_1880/g.4809  ORF Transcript_1880/g.4809 Transcript_1880/m.4809 type:complete len:85 (-) Transcript_1880:208-462(-)